MFCANIENGCVQDAMSGSTVGTHCRKRDTLGGVILDEDLVASALARHVFRATLRCCLAHDADVHAPRVAAGGVSAVVVAVKLVVIQNVWMVPIIPPLVPIELSLPILADAVREKTGLNRSIGGRSVGEEARVGLDVLASADLGVVLHSCAREDYGWLLRRAKDPFLYLCNHKGRRRGLYELFGSLASRCGRAPRSGRGDSDEGIDLGQGDDERGQAV